MTMNQDRMKWSTKTLDEVIKALEWCISDTEDDCAGCPYDKKEDGCHWRNLDALHYLKELRHILDNAIWIEPTKEENGYWKLSTLPETENDLLTWDEILRLYSKLGNR